MTHLTVELEKNPNFRKTYTKCTTKLATDNAKLLEAIQKGVSPDKSLLKSYLSFNKLLHEGAIVADNEDPDEDIVGYKEPEEEPVEECGDHCVDCPPEETPDVINEETNEDDPSVDLTPEEIKVLKSILNKISNLEVPEDEVDDTPTLEEPTNPVIPDEVNEDEDLTPADEDDDIPVDEDIPDEEPTEDNGVEDETDEAEVSEDLDIPLDVEDEDLEEDDEVDEPVEGEDTVEEDEVEDSEDDLPKRLEKLSNELNEVAEELQGNSDEEEEVTYEEDPELAECGECSDVNPDDDLEECDTPSLKDEDPDLEECDAPIIDDEDDLITEAITLRIKRCF